MNIPEIPRTITAVSEWAACFIYILSLKKRLEGFRLWAAVVAAFFILENYHVFIADRLSLDLWIPGMIAAVVLMFLFIYITCDITIASAACWCSYALILAEFSASLYWQIMYFYDNNFMHWNSIFSWILSSLIFFPFLYYLAYRLELRYMINISKIEFTWKDFYTSGCIVLVFFITSNLSFIKINTPFSARYPLEVFYIRTLVDLCGIILLYAQRESKHILLNKNEISTLQNMLVRQYEQYCISKESIDIINRKHHDLKHQISIIRAENDENVRETYLKELEEALNYYNAQYKTGNSVLDIILTSKSILCLEKNIAFTCVADGSLLFFMDVMDICSLFGNALDNAIESVQNIPDIEKRFIQVSMFMQNKLLIIRFENYYEGELLETERGFLTTKSDKNNHGYGLKSIMSIAEKYDGNSTVNAESNLFTLCVLIPIKE